ncbi:MAG TPA: hypothetical protein PK400_03985 [Phycisphaerales bacterium]|nr:hypothetical protein [Phycisphaerales bacterium]HRQ76831.1 hypothetical protein [Phycisphaerales bacterium]
MSTPTRKNLENAEGAYSSHPDPAAASAFDRAPHAEINIIARTMTSLAASTRVEPLSVEEARLADRVGRRVHEQVRAFLASLPAEARNASGLARFLDIDRTTCQRLVFAASRPYTGPEVFDRLPGVRGLRQIIDAANRATPAVKPDVLAALIAATDRFDEAIQALGGSQTALLRRIAATHLAAPDPTKTSAGDTAPARRRLFDAAAEITGRFSETWVAIYIYAPLGGSRDAMIDVARAHGLVGHIARPDAVPLTFHNFTSRREDEPEGEPQQIFHGLNDAADSDAPGSVLTEFSSSPAPVVSSRQPGEYLVQAIDMETGGRAPGGAIDLMFGTHSTMPHPAISPPRIEEVWAMINFPVRRMVFDVYLHRDMARECIPSLDMHLWRPDFAAHVGDRWQTRFSEAPRLELLGQGLTNAATPAYTRHAELTQFLFRRLSLDAGRFVGYRCAVDYPAWRTGYCMSFDFNREDDEPAPRGDLSS